MSANYPSDTVFAANFFFLKAIIQLSKMMKIKFSINLFLSKFFSSFDVRGPIQKRLTIMDFQTEIKDGCPDDATIRLPKRRLETIFRDRNAQKIVY